MKRKTKIIHTAAEKLALKEAKAEFNAWLKEKEKDRARVKKEAAKIRKATLDARAAAKKKSTRKKSK